MVLISPLLSCSRVFYLFIYLLILRYLLLEGYVCTDLYQYILFFILPTLIMRPCCIGKSNAGYMYRTTRLFSKLCTNHYKIKREDTCEQHHRRNTHTQTHTQESSTRPAIFFVNRKKTIIALSLALQQHSLTAKRRAANDLQPGINVCCSHLIWPWHPGFASVPQLGLSRV